MAPSSSTGAASGLLLLADISGYTGFLADVGTAHRDDAFADGRVPDAYALISTLLDGIIERLVPPFTLSKLEGDAVFVFADDTDDVPRGAAFLACLAACYGAFQEHLAGAERIWTCRCHACSRVDTLDLKFVIHAGGFFIQSIGGGRELVGPEVVMAHRLLKNGAAEQLGSWCLRPHDGHGCRAPGGPHARYREPHRDLRALSPDQRGDLPAPLVTSPSASIQGLPEGPAAATDAAVGYDADPGRE